MLILTLSSCSMGLPGKKLQNQYKIFKLISKYESKPHAKIGLFSQNIGKRLIN
jgi:hypothetical protein